MLSDVSRDFIREHRSDNVQQLALQSDRFQISGLDFKMALQQIEGRQHIEHKIPDWFELDNILYPKRLSIEQASSQTTALYKALLLEGKTFVDLTGGWGVDHAFIASQFEESVYIEKQKELADIAAHNFSTLGLKHAKIINADGLEFLQRMDKVDCIYIDPARRSKTGRKVTSILDCEPDLSEIQSLLLEKANRVLIKYSPMLDITQALQILNHVTEIYIVSVENECKELLFVLQKEEKTPVVHCLNFQKKGKQENKFLITEEKQCPITYTSKLETYLYEPNSSVLKAGFFKGLTQYFAIKKIHRDSHLYTSNERVADFPGRIFKINASYGFNKKDLRLLTSTIKSANLSTRNFPLKTEELRKRLNLKDGGSIYLFATTMGSKRIIIQCESVEK